MNNAQMPAPIQTLSDDVASFARQAQQAVQVVQSLTKGGGPAELIDALGSAGVLPDALGKQLSQASSLLANGMPDLGQGVAWMASALLPTPSGDAAVSGLTAVNSTNSLIDMKKR